jgi:D-psicose/D-tagatose/L-ribulose 3-epimerase
MKLGVSFFAWGAQFAPDDLHILPGLKAMGMDGCEIPMFEPGQLATSEIRRGFAASQLECTVCAILPAGINPLSPDAAARRKALEHLTACVETAAACGATLLGGPLYAPIGYLPEHRPSQDEWQWAVELFQSLGETLDAHQMTLSIEPVNRAETYFLRTAEEAQRLCRAVGHARIGVTIDTFHANIEEKKIPAALLALGSDLRHIHASENDRSVLGEGHVDFPGMVAALKQIGYQGYLMIEGFGYEASRRNAPGFLWAETGVSPRDLTAKSLAYLQGLLTDRPKSGS